MFMAGQNLKLFKLHRSPMIRSRATPPHHDTELLDLVHLTTRTWLPAGI
jgi:hypothetical protein